MVYKDLIVAVDCDGVLLDNGKEWLAYLMSHYKTKIPNQWLPHETLLPYNLTELFELPDGVSGFEWWHQSDLYDTLYPRKDALEFIPKLKERQIKIVFVSHCIGNHHNSKWRWLNGWFPDNDGIIFTDRKDLVKCDVIVDDTFKVLNTIDSQTTKIKFRMDYTEDVSKETDCIVVYNWEQTYDSIVKLDNLRRILR
jgi:5'(3')-deoxyribonucleotidase